MTCLYRTLQQMADIESDSKSIRLMITQVQAALETSPVLSGTKSYVFNAGTGDIREVFSSSTELMETLRRLMATRDRLEKMKNGTTNQSVRARITC